MSPDMVSVHLPDAMQSATISTLWSCNTIDKAQSYLDSFNGSSHITLTNYVGNQFLFQNAGTFIESFDPKTGRVYSKVPVTSAEDVDLAVSTAKEAFSTWSKTPRIVRSRFLQRIAALIEENKELFAVWESIDQGKTIERARIEVDRAIANFS